MTVPTAVSTVEYTGNGEATVFPVPFPYIDDSDLTVELLLEDETVATAWVLDTDYTLDASGVVATEAPADNSTLTITRTVPVTQLADLTADDYSPAVHVAALDKLAMVDQGIGSRLDVLEALVGRVATASAAAVTGALGAVSGLSPADFIDSLPAVPDPVRYYLLEDTDTQAGLGGTLPSRDPPTVSGRSFVSLGGNSLAVGAHAPQLLNYFLMDELVDADVALIEGDYDATSLDPSGAPNGYSVLGMWVGPVLASGGTFAGTGTLTFSVVKASLLGGNFSTLLAPCIYVWRPSTGALVGTLYNPASVAGTNPANIQATSPIPSTEYKDGLIEFTGSSVAYLTGDRVVCEVNVLIAGMTANPPETQRVRFSFRHAPEDWESDSRPGLNGDFVPYLELD